MPWLSELGKVCDSVFTSKIKLAGVLLGIVALDDGAPKAALNFVSPPPPTDEEIARTWVGVSFVPAPPPPTEEEIARTWVGVSEDRLFFWRITLKKSGTGEAAYVFLDDKPRLLQIVSWYVSMLSNEESQVAQIKIELTSEPFSPFPEITAGGTFPHSELLFLVVMKNKKLMRVILMPETKIEKYFQEIRARGDRKRISHV